MKERSEEPARGRVPAGSGSDSSISRRGFLQSVGLAAGSAVLPAGVRTARAAEEGAAGAGMGPGAVKLKLKINGETKAFEAEPRLTLADVLRDKLDLTGTKVVCDRGACGACTVLVNGEAVCSCMMLAVDALGKDVTTIEGLAKPDGTLDPVQAAFIEHDAQQCGFCTPGLVMRSRSFLNENPHPTVDEIKRGLSGNICRCGTYTHVIAAVLTASKKEA